MERYKTQIKREFFPARGFGGGRISIAKKPVSEYAKVAHSAEGLADLMLYYVETGVQYTNTYGDIDEPFYNSIERMYERACKLILKEEMTEKFAGRCEKIVKDTSGIGWGFHDMLSQIYFDYIEMEEDDD